MAENCSKTGNTAKINEFAMLVFSQKWMSPWADRLVFSSEETFTEKIATESREIHKAVTELIS